MKFSIVVSTFFKDMEFSRTIYTKKYALKYSFVYCNGIFGSNIFHMMNRSECIIFESLIPTNLIFDTHTKLKLDTEERKIIHEIVPLKIWKIRPLHQSYLKQYPKVLFHSNF